MLANLRELYQYRALLFNLVGRDLKARYRGSVLGFLWTFLNPLLLMAVYSLVFSVIMRNGAVKHYSYFLFVGLLPWIWFSTTILTGTTAISDHRDLVTKVKFPPQVLPTTVMISSLVNYVFSLPLMAAFAIWEQIPMGWPLVCFPLLVLIQALFSLGIAYFTAAMNVTFRDLQHILVNVLTFAYFVTPILYMPEQVPEKFRWIVVTFNPMAALSGAYQAIFYHNRWPDFQTLGVTGAVAFVLFWSGALYMNARRENFAEVA